MASDYAKQFLLKTVSVLSTSDVRYEGKLYLIDDQACQIALQTVRCLGTEGRRSTGHEIPASDQTYEYIMFKPENVKRLYTSGSERETDLTRSVLQPLQRLKKGSTGSSSRPKGDSGEASRSGGGNTDRQSANRERRRGGGSGGRNRYNGGDGRRGDSYRRDRRGGYRQDHMDAGSFAMSDPSAPHTGPLSDFYRGSYTDYNDYGSVRYFREQSQRRDPQSRGYGTYQGGYDRRYYDRPPPGRVMGGGGGGGRRDYGPGGRPPNFFAGGRGGRREGTYGAAAYYGGQRGRGRGRGGYYRRGGYRGGGRRRNGRAGTGAYLNEYNLRGDEIRVDGGEFDFAKAREKAEKELTKNEELGAGSGDAKVEAVVESGPVSLTAGPESEFYSEGKPAYDMTVSFFDCLTIDSRKGLMDKGKEKAGGAEEKEESKAEIKRTPDEAQKIRQQIMAQNTATFGTVADGYRARSFRYRNRGVHRGGGSGGYGSRGGRGPMSYYDRRAGGNYHYNNNHSRYRKSGGYLPYSDKSGAPPTNPKSSRKQESSSSDKASPKVVSEPKESRPKSSAGVSDSGSKKSNSFAGSSKVWVRRQ